MFACVFISCLFNIEGPPPGCNESNAENETSITQNRDSANGSNQTASSSRQVTEETVTMANITITSTKLKSLASTDIIAYDNEPRERPLKETFI